VYTLLNLMPTAAQRDSLQVLLGLFLQADGRPLPEYSKIKSPGALSRFLNQYQWSTQGVIRALRQAILDQLLNYQPRGRRPWLQVMIDLTTLEKCGKFKAFGHLIHVLQGKRGIHLVVLYLCVGPFRFPWGFRVWRGKGSRTASELALRLVDRLPTDLTRAFRVMILADTGFGSVDFLKGVRKRGYAAIVGVRCDRKLADGRYLYNLGKSGQQVRLDQLPFPVTVAWFYLKRDGKLEKRWVLSTRPLKAKTIIWWGKRRWAIEGFFKTSKHRFGLHRFGQGTLKGVYRWFVLCLAAFVLAHWSYLSSGSSMPPDWGAAADLALQLLLPQIIVCDRLIQLERRRSLLESMGFDVQVNCLQS
jgi:Transposase DDE domain